MKKLIPLLLVLALLCGCAPQTLPTAPTTPPTQGSDYPDAQLDGLGRVCGILPSEGGYLVMTHSGFYRVDENFRLVDSSDLSALNALFEATDGSDPFCRMKLDLNYDTPLLTALTQTSRGVMFFCYSNGTFYLNGEPWYAVLYGKSVSTESSVQVIEHEGAIYTLVCGEATNRLTRDGETVYQMPEENAEFELGGSRSYAGMTVLGGQLYVAMESYRSTLSHAYNGGVMRFLLPVPADSAQLSYDETRSGYGAIGAQCAASDGGTWLYDGENLLHITTEKTEEISLEGMTETYQYPAQLHETVDGLIVLTQNGQVVRLSALVTDSRENITLTCGYVREEADYPINTVENYFPLLANSTVLPGVSICARGYDSVDALCEAASAGELDLIGAPSLQTMREIEQRGLLADLCRTNASLFEENSSAGGVLSPAVVHTFAENGSAGFIPTQLTVKATLLYSDARDSKFWTAESAPVVRTLDELAQTLAQLPEISNFSIFELYSKRAVLTSLLTSLIDGNVDFSAGTATLDNGSLEALLRYCDRFDVTEFEKYGLTHLSHAYEILQSVSVSIKDDVTIDSMKTATELFVQNIGLLSLSDLGSDGLRLYAGDYLGIAASSAQTESAAEALMAMLKNTAMLDANGCALPVLRETFQNIMWRSYTIDGVNRDAEVHNLLESAFQSDHVTIRDETYTAVEAALHYETSRFFEGLQTLEQTVQRAQQQVSELLAE